jgi:glutamate decarboxylase
MESEADKLFMENINKNIIDIFEYPQTDKIIHGYLVNMLGYLFNGHDKEKNSWAQQQQALQKP